MVDDSLFIENYIKYFQKNHEQCSSTFHLLSNVMAPITKFPKKT